MEDLNEEKKALEDKIQANYKAIDALETAILWDKKRLTLVNAQLAGESPKRKKRTSAELLQDISKGLK